MSRPISVRVQSRSPLDAIADGPQAREFGLTRRLHNVAARYELVLRSYRPPFHPDELRALAEGMRAMGTPPTSLATPALMTRLKDQLVSVARSQIEGAAGERLAHKIRQLSVVGLVVALEIIEEVALIRPPGSSP